MGVIVGIDLGTTNSCVAIVKDGRPKVIEDERGYNILPSCVAMKGRGRFVVGHGAKALILTNPHESVYAVKRLVGRKFHSAEVQEAIRHVSYEVMEGDHGSVLVRMGDIELTPVEVSSIILKAVKEIAERALGEAVSDAVITVPANFSHAQRTATMEAGEKAGLNVLRLLNEPTAAALAYGFKKDINKRIAIYDLGGGTFDVSVLEIGDGVYEILGTAGNTFLGGEDFDYRIVNWLADHFTHSTGIDPRHDREALQRLKDAAERAKCELSFVDRTPVLIPRLYGDYNLEVELTRESLEAMVQDLVNETIRITDSALRAAGLAIEDLDEIILVGGMTRMPKIQETIKVFFGMNPCKGVHPEEVVAVGAAVHGYSLETETDSTLLLDVTPMTLGLETAGGFYKPIIERNSTVPANETRTFTTVRDGQSEVKVVVRQGESKIAAENDLLGEFTLTGIREAEKMAPRIDVTFRIDSNGILHVTAVDRDTGENATIEIRDYVEHATGEPQKAVSLARADLISAARADAPDPQEKQGLFSRLKQAAGGKKKETTPPRAEAPKGAAGKAAATKAASAAPRSNEVAERAVAGTEVTERTASSTDVTRRESGTTDVQERTTRPEPDLLRTTRPVVLPEEVADSELPMAFGDEDDDGSSVSDAPAPTGRPIEPHGVAPRGKAAARNVDIVAVDDDLAADLRQAVSQTARKMPVQVPADPYGVAPRNPKSATRAGLDALGGTAELDFGSDDLAGALALTDQSGLASGDLLDPFAVAPRGKGAQRDVNLTSDDIGDLSGLSGVDPFAVASRESGVKPPSRRREPAPSARAASAAGDDRTTPSGADDVTSAPGDDATAPVAGDDRRPARLKIAYKKAQTFKREYAANLQRGGTFIKTKKPLDLGRACVLHLTVPGVDDPIEVRGSVVWSSKGAELGPGQEEGMGIRYDPDDLRGLDRLRMALQQVG